MMSHFKNLQDEPFSFEKQARLDALLEQYKIAWELEATRRFGPPEVRACKNQRYAMQLIRRHSEQTIRGILKALSKLDDPMCCKNLRSHDLDAKPLEQIIQPFDLISISTISERRFTVNISEAYDIVGSGGQFVIEQFDDGSFRIIDTLSQWVA